MLMKSRRRTPPSVAALPASSVCSTVAIAPFSDSIRMWLYRRLPEDPADSDAPHG
jgi:hypothetical protein